VCLSLMAFASATPSERTPEIIESCLAAEAAGVKLDSISAVGHGIHSLTVEDIRYFFEEDFPVENTIPTVNIDLDAEEEYLPYAPSFPSKFKFPGGANYDRILSYAKGHVMAKDFTILELLGHNIHMSEMYLQGSKMYRDIKNQNIDLAKVCPCMVDEENNGIAEFLRIVAKTNKKSLYPVTSGARKGKSLAHERRGIPYVWGDGYTRSSETGRKKRSLPIIPLLEDDTTWRDYWRPNLLKYMNKDEMYNFAMYMYCKINM